MTCGMTEDYVKKPSENEGEMLRYLDEKYLGRYV